MVNRVTTAGDNNRVVNGPAEEAQLGTNIIVPDAIQLGGQGDLTIGGNVAAGTIEITAGKSLTVGTVGKVETQGYAGSIQVVSGVNATFGGDIGSPEDHNLMIKVEESATATFNLPGFAQHIVTGPAEFSAAEWYSEEVAPLGASDVDPVDHVGA